MMKDTYVIPILILVAIGILFFFPNPQSNFLAYLGTALIFIMIIFLVYRWKHAKTNNAKGKS